MRLVSAGLSRVDACSLRQRELLWGRHEEQAALPRVQIQVQSARCQRQGVLVPDVPRRGGRAPKKSVESATKAKQAEPGDASGRARGGESQSDLGRVAYFRPRNGRTETEYGLLGSL